MADNSPSNSDLQMLQKQYAKLIAKAWRDEGFKQRLINDPGTVLKQEGIPVKAGRDVKVVEQTDATFYFVLPPRPSNLTDEQLNQPIPFSCVVTECDICATK